MSTDRRSLDDEALSGVTGGAGNQTLRGDSNNDTLTGGAGHDLIQGFNSQDHLDGRGGNDGILAGDGDDTARGGAGQDYIDGGSGQDRLFGNAGNDQMFGGDGDDVMVGGTGADYQDGGQGQDVFRWHPGEGNDTVFGGEGDDTLVLEDSGMTLDGLRDAFTPDPGVSGQPRVEGGFLNVKGLSGTITIGQETIRFSGLERISLGFYQFSDGRTEAN